MEGGMEEVTELSEKSNCYGQICLGSLALSWPLHETLTPCCFVHVVDTPKMIVDDMK